MLLREFLELVYRKTNIRIIEERGVMDDLFSGVKGDVPSSLMGRKVDFFDAELRPDFNDGYTVTAGIKIFVK